MGNVEYKNRKIRIIASFAVSFYMLVHGTNFDFYRAFTSPSFYLVFGISFIATFLIIEFVHYISVRLDTNYGWRATFKKRMVAQLIFGLLIPLIADIIIFSVYFGFLGQNILHNGFLSVDIPYIISLLLILNLYYSLHYWILTDKINAENEINPIFGTLADQHTNTDKIFVIQQKGRSVHFVIQDILYFYRDGKQVAFVTKDNELFRTYDNLSTLEEHFSQHGFLRINRSIVFNFNEVLGYENGTRRNTLKMVLKPKYHTHLSNLSKDRFTVTNDHISDVVRRFSQT